MDAIEAWDAVGEFLPMAFLVWYGTDTITLEPELLLIRIGLRGRKD